jgi:predicted metallo-beta-lactamase superfamily hydrolase
MMQKLRNSVRSKLQTGLQLWKTFDDNVDMNRAWKNIRENIKTSAKESLGHYELQQHKPWFDDEYSKLIDRR